MNLHAIIGNNIRCFRNKLGWSQEKLGTETGLNHDYIGRLERGLENIGIDNLNRISEIFGIGISDLLIENYCSSQGSKEKKE